MDMIEFLNRVLPFGQFMVAIPPNGELPDVVEIPDVSRLDLLKWFRMLNFKLGAEIGVACGEYSKLMCEINPQALIIGVDSWAPYKGYTDYTRKSTFSIMEDEANRRLINYVKRDRYRLVKGFSMDVVKTFQDNSLDFVYIDANHEDPFVTQDITEWSKKVRPGGIVAGHDYVRVRNSQKGLWGVKEAVDNYVKANNIKPLFILGTKAEVVGQVREGFRTWMFVKP